MLIQLEWRGNGGIEHFNVFCQHFNHTRRHVGVLGAFWAQPNATSDTQDKFTAGTVGISECLGGIRIDHELCDAVAIAHIEENYPTVVTAAMNPSAYRNRLIHQSFV